MIWGLSSTSSGRLPAMQERGHQNRVAVTGPANGPESGGSEGPDESRQTENSQITETNRHTIPAIPVGNRSSSGYPAAMLAAWMALESRAFSLVDPLDFIVTVNKGIEPPDCWIFLPRTV